MKMEYIAMILMLTCILKGVYTKSNEGIDILVDNNKGKRSPCTQNLPGFCPQVCLKTGYDGCIHCNCTSLPTGTGSALTANSNTPQRGNFLPNFNSPNLNPGLQANQPILASAQNTNSAQNSLNNNPAVSGPGNPAAALGGRGMSNANPSNPINYGGLGLGNVLTGGFNPANTFGVNPALPANPSH